MNRRPIPATVCVVLAAVVAGMLFAPVFGVPALLLPVAGPAAGVLLVALLCRPGSGPAAWRPLLTAGAGLLVVAETVAWPTTMAGLPTAATGRAIAAGVTESWRLALQSTWPARPDPALLLFVPLLVVAAAVLGVELLHHLSGPLPALVPSLALVLFTQLYAAAPAGPAVVAALLYTAVAGALLSAVRAGGSSPPLRFAAPAFGAVAMAVLAGLLLPAGPPRYALRHGQAAPLVALQVTSPLDDLARRLTDPGTPVFRFRGVAPPDRWPLVVLDEFDGVNWRPPGTYRRLGAELPPGPEVTVPAERRTATVEVTDVGGPWLPSQTWPAAVGGVAPLVAERHGTLIRSGDDGPVRYDLDWWEPRADPGALADAAVDSTALGGLGGVGIAPPDMTDLAARATGGIRPSFRTALVLESHFRRNYRLAVGDDLPTGHAWPQLVRFLQRTRRGTSEQFAAAYVALARIHGIPARMAVGFRTPESPGPDGWYTVRNGDALAWPEVAVEGVGWVALDPAGAAVSAPTGESLAATTDRARAELPAPEDLRDPPLPAPLPEVPAPAVRRGGAPVPWSALLIVPVLALVCWPVVIPAAWTVRSWRRRRRAGAGAVVGAWEEARDRLRAYGVAAPPAMTPRDLAAGLTDPGVAVEIRRLGVALDRTLWSGKSADERQVGEAWAAVRAVRRGLARRGVWPRLRAVLGVRGLGPPR
ncbi:transglutaminaseTgpA domain-containing protein [Jidongwangia harbinensis]|uniref:transglutaminaseTgpA domain-containing protein n=1 Tax=Jidongwangia harbinensis TaxID=2878561 RepID=UPI001CD9DF22|nr:transglutaminaseTgpA domain-containing protein [Jidongwangia harbinensis]MCA2217942.1 transglutaminaseTgpA domain-containing protein [Jidongwangia harbinensis]